MSRVENFSEGAGRLYGAGGIDKMFPGGGDITTTPWPMAGKSKTHQDYDPDVVRGELAKKAALTPIDPRGLKSTQPNVTRAGVDYYLNSDQYSRIGKTFADHDNEGNRWPTVYRRPTMADPTQQEDIILTGHHRASAALLRGEALNARLIEGGRPPRRRA